MFFSIKGRKADAQGKGKAYFKQCPGTVILSSFQEIELGNTLNQWFQMVGLVLTLILSLDPAWSPCTPYLTPAG